MIDLAEFLEANCSYLTEQIAKVPAKGPRAIARRVS